MDWYVLRTREDERVLQDLSTARIRAYRPVFTLEYFSQRKSVVMTRTLPLIEGHLLVGVPVVPPGVTRHWHDVMRDHLTGNPLRVPEADDLILRCEMGEFDVSHRTKEPGHFDKGSRVRVVLLGLEGVIQSLLSRQKYLVLLDIGRTVEVRQPGLEAA